MLKVEDLVVGEVYYQKFADDDEDHYICRFSGYNKMQGNDTFIHIEKEDFCSTGFTDGISIITLRKARLEEVLWLEACERRGEYVSKIEVLNDIKPFTEKELNKISKLINEFENFTT